MDSEIGRETECKTDRPTVSEYTYEWTYRLTNRYIDGQQVQNTLWYSGGKMARQMCEKTGRVADSETRRFLEK